MSSPKRLAVRSVGLFIGLAAAALARSRGHEHAWVVIAAIAISLFTITVASASIAQRVDAALAAFAHFVGEVLTFVLLVSQFYLLVLPAGLLGRLRGRRSIATRFARGDPTYWSRVVPQGVLPHRTYMKEARVASAGSGLVGALGLAALLLVLDVGAGALLNRFWLDDYDSYRKFYGGWAPAPAMRASSDWLKAWMTEWAYTYRRTRWEPYAGWKREDYAGTYVNIQDGVRRTWQSPRAKSPGALRIWVFGGSTLWGDGARDDHTIPSELARILDAKGIAAEVINHGEGGWSQWEERLKFESLLASGARADLVIFYDGGNEHINQLRVGGTEGPLPMMASKMKFIVKQNGELMPSVKRAELISTLFNELSERFGPQWVPGSAWVALDPARSSAAIARIYLASVETASATAERNGIPAAFFWQPWYPTTTNPDPEDAAFLEPSFKTMANIRSLCEATGALVRKSPLVHDLSGVLDDAKEPLYIDVVHVNERGNEKIAQHLYDGIEPLLKERLGHP